MGGLIPLLLPGTTGGRTNIDLASTGPRRTASLSSLKTPPVSLSHRRQQSVPALGHTKRPSNVIPTPLASIPFTAEEWRIAVDEVKRKYLARKYRSCSSRCCEILDSIKDKSSVEPLYLIYLHFYAASSFEWCARPLSSSSNYRTKLLRDARSHYDRAEALINVAEENMAGRTRSPSTVSIPSMHSPGLSASSRTSTTSSAMSSPRTSVFSLDDDPTKASPRSAIKPKKKVSFSGLPELIEFQPEPYIRPDSPTLGWEDDYFIRRPDPSLQTAPEITKALKSAPQPEPILKSGSQPEVEPKMEETTSDVPIGLELRRADDDAIGIKSPVDCQFDLDAFLQSRSINRICSQLSALRSQVSWHRDAVDNLLAIPDDTPETPSLPSDFPLSPLSLSNYPTSPRHIRAITLPASLDLASPSEPASARSDVAEMMDEVWPLPPRNESRAANLNPQAIARPASAASTIRPGGTNTDDALQQRIERLRASGWKRRRFDSRRYEALREQVLGELGA
ncbi:hypothetical protein F4809DRAFT_515601 [Biscogniauxia mediterranea]|nr:hypothetical protein F4809DRAFT_515601 [Biscogniauxia mediterranea]